VWRGTPKNRVQIGARPADIKSVESKVSVEIHSSSSCQEMSARSRN
jgi:hypothetical protein